MIKKEDFTKEEVEDHPTPYFQYREGEIKICLEPCMSGLCVGIYDDEDWILAEKKCTNMPGAPKEEIIKKAVELANEIYSEWKDKNIID